MAKGTFVFLSFLSILATLLVGINIGKKIEMVNQAYIPPTPTVYLVSSPTITILPTIISTPTSTLPLSTPPTNKVKAISTYKDESCGFQLIFPSAYLSQHTEDEKSIIFTNPNDPNDALIIVCDKTIPKPSVAPEKIEAVTLDKTAAILYHDQNPDGSPRDEVIVKNPENGLEIIIAGYGETFQTALKTFKFL